MWSVCNLFSDASTCRMIHALLSPLPCSGISAPTLVAITTLSRLPLCLNQLPIIVSLSPPWCPGTHVEYVSAVSIKFSPAPTKASSILNDVASSAVQPNTLPPSISGATSIEDCPSWRFFIADISKLYFTSAEAANKDKGRSGFNDGPAPQARNY